MSHGSDERLTFEEHRELKDLDMGAALVAFVEAERLLDEMLFLLLGLSHVVVFFVEIAVLVITLPLISSPMNTEQSG